MSVVSWLADRFGYLLYKGAEVGGRYILPYQSGKPYNPPIRPEQFLKRYTGWVNACASIVQFWHLLAQARL